MNKSKIASIIDKIKCDDIDKSRLKLMINDIICADDNATLDYIDRLVEDGNIKPHWIHLINTYKPYIVHLYNDAIGREKGIGGKTKVSRLQSIILYIEVQNLNSKHYNVLR